MTNGDLIRQMSDKQLAALVSEDYASAGIQKPPDCSNACERDGDDDYCIFDCPFDHCRTLRKKAAEEWIKQELIEWKGTTND